MFAFQKIFQGLSWKEFGQLRILNFLDFAEFCLRISGCSLFAFLNSIAFYQPPGGRGSCLLLSNCANPLLLLSFPSPLSDLLEENEAPIDDHSQEKAADDDPGCHESRLLIVLSISHHITEASYDADHDLVKSHYSVEVGLGIGHHGELVTETHYPL